MTLPPVEAPLRLPTQHQCAIVEVVSPGRLALVCQHRQISQYQVVGLKSTSIDAGKEPNLVSVPPTNAGGAASPTISKASQTRPDTATLSNPPHIQSRHLNTAWSSTPWPNYRTPLMR